MLELFRITHRWIQQLEMLVDMIQLSYPPAPPPEKPTDAFQIDDDLHDPYAW